MRVWKGKGENSSQRFFINSLTLWPHSNSGVRNDFFSPTLYGAVTLLDNYLQVVVAATSSTIREKREPHACQMLLRWQVSLYTSTEIVSE